MQVETSATVNHHHSDTLIIIKPAEDWFTVLMKQTWHGGCSIVHPKLKTHRVLKHLILHLHKLNYDVTLTTSVFCLFCFLPFIKKTKLTCSSVSADGLLRGFLMSAIFTKLWKLEDLQRKRATLNNLSVLQTKTEQAQSSSPLGFILQPGRLEAALRHQHQRSETLFKMSPCWEMALCLYEDTV